MNIDEHLKIHVDLHKKLDEIVSDFIQHTGNTLSNTSIMELIQWSYSQTKPETIKHDNKETAIEK